MMQKDVQNTVLWWVGWIALTIVTFFAAAWFWTGVVAKHVGTMDVPAARYVWVAAVFGSWMVLLVPLVILMYNKVDKAYEDARIGRETAAFEKAKKEFRVRSVFIEESERVLPKELAQKLKSHPAAVKRGHLVTAVLKDGRRIDNVFVLDRKNVLGVYGLETMTFAVKDVVDVVPADLDRIPPFETEGWLRLDGVGTSPA